jgi:hypothetical protein
LNRKIRDGYQDRMIQMASGDDTGGDTGADGGDRCSDDNNDSGNGSGDDRVAMEVGMMAAMGVK